MSLPEILFKGVPRSYTRGYTAKVLTKVSPEEVVIPCCGAYALTTTAVQAGVAPEHIHCCDISLLSSALGFVFTGEDMHIEMASGEFAEELSFLSNYLDTPVNKAAAVIFALRYVQYRAKIDEVFWRDRLRQMLFQKEDYVAQAQEQVKRLDSYLHGLDFRAEDMWDLLARWKENQNAVFLVNPPRYAGGYEKMFAGIESVFSWDEPEVKQFHPSQYQMLLDYIEDCKLAMLYYATPEGDPAEEFTGPWRSVFADKPGKSRTAAINWILANRSVTEVMHTRYDVKPLTKAKYKLFDGEIAPESTLVVQPEKQEVVQYYRDLFVHKLALSNAERYVVLLVDGCLVGVLGFIMRDLYGAGSGSEEVDKTVFLQFAVTVPHDKYPRLHKLTLMSAVSSWFWEALSTNEPALSLYGPPVAIRTVMLTDKPESKTARGILKMTERERLPDGDYKLFYFSPLVQRSMKETIGEWIRKYRESIKS